MESKRKLQDHSELLSDLGDMVKKATYEMTQSLIHKRETVIRERVKEITGIEID